MEPLVLYVFYQNEDWGKMSFSLRRHSLEDDPPPHDWRLLLLIIPIAMCADSIWKAEREAMFWSHACFQYSFIDSGPLSMKPFEWRASMQHLYFLNSLIYITLPTSVCARMSSMLPPEENWQELALSLLCESQGWISGCQAWQQVPLLAEPSQGPSSSVTFYISALKRLWGNQNVSPSI